MTDCPSSRCVPPTTRSPSLLPNCHSTAVACPDEGAFAGADGPTDRASDPHSDEGAFAGADGPADRDPNRGANPISNALPVGRGGAGWSVHEMVKPLLPTRALAATPGCILILILSVDSILPPLQRGREVREQRNLDVRTCEQRPSFQLAYFYFNLQNWRCRFPNSALETARNLQSQNRGWKHTSSPTQFAKPVGSRG